MQNIYKTHENTTYCKDPLDKCLIKDIAEQKGAYKHLSIFGEYISCVWAW